MRFEEWMQAHEITPTAARAANNVNYVFLWANRALDTVKETVWIDFGLPFTSNFIHEIAHINLERLDAFGDMLHELHFRQTYPATPSLDETIASMDEVFEIVAEVIDGVDVALREFITAAGREYTALSLSAENLLMANSADRTRVLQAWKMWDERVSPSSFDNWVAKMSQGGAADDED